MSDLISRRDAIRILDSAWVDGTEYQGYLHEEFEKLPSVDAVKHGRWIPVDWKEPRRYGCSECHRMVWQLENYCPNCGARMDGEENG